MCLLTYVMPRKFRFEYPGAMYPPPSARLRRGKRHEPQRPGRSSREGGRLSWLAAGALCLLSSGTGRAADSPLTVTAQPAGGGGILLSWPTVTGRPYGLQFTTNPGQPWTPLTSPALPMLATTSALNLSIGTAAPSGFYRVRETPSPYDPPWSTVMPLRTILFSYNAGLTSAQNGANLTTAIQALLPGDQLVVGAGTYNFASYTSIALQGTSTAPIWIVAAPDAKVVITRPDANQNIINVGASAPARYLCFQGLEFTGGSQGIKLFDCANLWINQCLIHDTGDSCLTANSSNTSYLYVTRNQVWNPDTAGSLSDAVYLGANAGLYTMSQSVIALNTVYGATTPAPGIGIEVKQGSWGNEIAANLVHDCARPCLLVYGTGGLPSNIVENNRCFRSGDYTLQVQGECLVRNNLVVAGNGYCFASLATLQGSPTRLTVVQNTFVNTNAAVRLSAWESGTNMVFANNACYSQSGQALTAATSTAGVIYAGNIAYGAVTSGVGGFQPGAGLGDFVNLSWDSTLSDARPSSASPLRGAAAAAYASATDIDFYPRSAPDTTGCFGP